MQTKNIQVPTLQPFFPTIRFKVRTAKGDEADAIRILRRFAEDQAYVIETRDRPLQNVHWSARLKGSNAVLFVSADKDGVAVFGVASNGAVLDKEQAKPINDALHAAFRDGLPHVEIIDETHKGREQPRAPY